MYKKHKIVMLPHNNINTTITLYHHENGKKELSCNNDLLIPHSNQHLYILSDDDIVEGDWFINYSMKNIPSFGIPCQANSIGVSLINTKKDYISKIIASTDKSLLTEIDCPDNIEGCEVYHAICLPSIPEYFIKYYIEQFNLGNVIQEVEVFYDEYFDLGCTTYTLDVDDYNNIVIKSPGYNNTFNEDKTYSRSEVVKLLHKFRDSPNRAYNFSMEDWIEQNLK